jgi:hypothetical protein
MATKNPILDWPADWGIIRERSGDFRNFMRGIRWKTSRNRIPLSITICPKTIRFLYYSGYTWLPAMSEPATFILMNSSLFDLKEGCVFFNFPAVSQREKL